MSETNFSFDALLGLTPPDDSAAVEADTDLDSGFAALLEHTAAAAPPLRAEDFGDVLPFQDHEGFVSIRWLPMTLKDTEWVRWLCKDAGKYKPLVHPRFTLVHDGVWEQGRQKEVFLVRLYGSEASVEFGPDEIDGTARQQLTDYLVANGALRWITKDGTLRTHAKKS